MSLLAEDGVDFSGEAVRVRVLGEPDRGDLLALVDADPIVNAVADLRIRARRVIGAIAGSGEPLGVFGADGTLRSASLDVGNLQPIGGTPEDWSLLGASLRVRARRCSSIVGRHDAVTTLWREVAPTWGPARVIRAAQPLLVSGVRPSGGDDRVRRMRTADTERYLPAAAAMFEEELGIAPLRRTSASDFRRRVDGLISAERAFAIVEDSEVVFKADLGTVTARTCQSQGVWVRPDLRGRCIATSAMAQVLCHALDLAPTASLYVNDFNTPARRLYARLGMTETAVLSTVLF